MIRRLITGALAALALLTGSHGALAQDSVARGLAGAAAAQASQAKTLALPATPSIFGLQKGAREQTPGPKLHFLGNSHVNPTGGVYFSRLLTYTAPGQSMAGWQIDEDGYNGVKEAAFCAVGGGVEHVLGADDWATFATIPTAGSTMVVAGTTVTFISNGSTPSGNQVALGVDLPTTLANLATFLNASADANISKATYVAAGPDIDGVYKLRMFARAFGAAGVGLTLATTVTGATVSTPATTGPDAVGIYDLTNDTRLGALTQVQAQAVQDTCIGLIRSSWPNATMLPIVPAVWLYDDPTGAGYVALSPGTASGVYGAQNLWNLTRNATYASAANWSNTYVLDFGKVEGLTSQLLSVDLNDQIHHSSIADNIEGDYTASFVGTGVLGTPLAAQSLAEPLQPAVSDHAIRDQPGQPWVLYPRIVEDARYFTQITHSIQPSAVTNAATQVTFADTGPSATIRSGDIICYSRLKCEVLGTSISTSKVAGYTNIAGLGTGFPSVASGSYTVQVFRPIYGDGQYAVDTSLRDTYLLDTATYPRQIPVYIVGGGANYIRLIGVKTSIFNINHSSSAKLVTSGYNTCAVAGGGANYAANDTVTLGNNAVVQVLSVTSGAATTCQVISQPGAATGIAANAQAFTSGSGSGGTFTISNVAEPLSSIYLPGSVITNGYRFYQPGSGTYLTSLTGRYGWIVDNQSTITQGMDDAGQAIEYSQGGTLVADTQYRPITIGSQLTNMTAPSLATASTSGAVTATISVSGTALATITYAQGSTSPTVAYNSSGNSTRCNTTSCYVAANDNVQITISPGSGAAGLAFRWAR